MKFESKAKAFTIVELLVVIVVIGILASITIVSNSGVTKRANEAAIKSDLSSTSRQLVAFQVTSPNDSYPDTINCAIPDSVTNKCLKPSGNNSFNYSVNNSLTPKQYTLIVTNSGSIYRSIEGSISSGPWIPGKAATPLAGKFVLGYDLGGAFAYKINDSVVTAPQGQVGLDSSYPAYTNLVSPRLNPNVSFAEYPAQNACAKVGGRLPTASELDSIYADRITLYGNNFTTNPYWNSMQHLTMTNIAIAKYFLDGTALGTSKSSVAGDVRCVAD